MNTEFNWRPDLPDYRDYRFKASLPTPIPDLVDMRDDKRTPPIDDMQRAVMFAYQCACIRLGCKYEGHKWLENDWADEGVVEIRTSMKVVAKYYPPLKYERVAQTPVSLKKALARGLPIVFGFSAYENYGSDIMKATNYLSMPGPRQRLIGGKVAVLVGYDTLHRTFLVRDKSYFTMPAAYVSHTDLARDFWIIREVE